MGRKKVEEIVEELVLPITSKHQFELVDIEFKKEGSNWYLRVYIDKPEGIALNDCELVSEGLSDILDQVDPIEQSYILEVSSPGIDRPLKRSEDFERFKDHKIEIKLYAPYKGKKKYIGNLKGLINDNIHIEGNDGERIEIPLKSTASVRLHVEF